MNNGTKSGEIAEVNGTDVSGDAFTGVNEEVQSGFRDWKSIEDAMKTAQMPLPHIDWDAPWTGAEIQARLGKREGTEVPPQAMTAITRQQLRDISEKYGVKFITSGNVKYDGYTVKAGIPTGDEIDAMERVLKNIPNVNYKNLEIVFVDKNRRPRSELAVHETEGDRSRIMLMPLGRIRGTDGWDKLESDFSHEVTHEEQHQFNKGFELGHPMSTPEGQRLFREMGWIMNPRTGARLLDRDGGQWSFSGNRHWDFVGGTKPSDNKTRVTNDEMRELAKIRPSTGYFQTADEMHAESVSRFRMDRQGLAKEAPDMYHISKAYDQRMIDKAFQHVPPGSFIRGIKGAVIPSTPASRDAVEEAERRWGLFRRA